MMTAPMMGLMALNIITTEAAIPATSLSHLHTFCSVVNGLSFFIYVPHRFPGRVHCGRQDARHLDGASLFPHHQVIDMPPKLVK
jgi:hypothetical protein